MTPEEISAACDLPLDRQSSQNDANSTKSSKSWTRIVRRSCSPQSERKATDATGAPVSGMRLEEAIRRPRSTRCKNYSSARTASRLRLVWATLPWTPNF
jgi:hypothetical protein